MLMFHFAFISKRYYALGLTLPFIKNLETWFIA